MSIDTGNDSRALELCGLNQSQLVATLWLPQVHNLSLHPTCKLCVRLARAQEEQNNVEWIPKCFVHAHSVSGSIQHCFAPRGGYYAKRSNFGPPA